MNIVFAGGSGFLGHILRKHFAAQGHTVTNLSRCPEPESGPGETVGWDGRTLGPWAEQLSGADVVINLSGKSVDCRYNQANRKAIYDSRLDSTRALGQAIALAPNPPSLWINAASATIYRHAEDRSMDEATGELGTGFSVDVCKHWEQTFFDSEVPDSVRRVALRIAIVLGRDGGAFKPIQTLARIGLGGRQGNGRQYISWLHEEDFAEIVAFVISREGLSGVINVSAPEPEQNATFMSTLRRIVGMPIGLPTPVWLLAIGAVIIRTEPELVLKSRWVTPRRLLESGYEFRFSKLEDALRNLAKKDQRT
jgi:uncharacterized protein